MPSPLPFVDAPTIRTERITATIDGQECSLEFPVYGAMKGKELIAIRSHEYEQAVYRESSRLADALVAEAIEEAEAQRLAIRILSTRMGIPVPLEPSEQRIMLRHAALVADVSCVLQDEHLRQRLRTITAFINYRLPGCADWSLDDAGDLPQPLQDAIFAFAEREQSAGNPQRTPDELVEEMIETLGKLAPETDPPPSTGEPSSGAADDSGHTPPSSAPTASETSPSPTSSKRSRKASAGKPSS